MRFPNLSVVIFLNGIKLTKTTFWFRGKQRTAPQTKISRLKKLIFQLLRAFILIVKI